MTRASGGTESGLYGSKSQKWKEKGKIGINYTVDYLVPRWRGGFPKTIRLASPNKRKKETCVCVIHACAVVVGAMQYKDRLPWSAFALLLLRATTPCFPQDASDHWS